jgi:hypothetical protein
VCFHLLCALGEGFDVLGSHQTVSSSSLPLSTPPEIVDMMIDHFSEQLKDDALALLPLSTAHWRPPQKNKSTPKEEIQLNHKQCLFQKVCRVMLLFCWLRRFGGR